MSELGRVEGGGFSSREIVSLFNGSTNQKNQMMKKKRHLSEERLIVVKWPSHVGITFTKVKTVANTLC